ncbi:hypothetical protein HDU96_003502 [Phlyctochytrium bullatum]|nr:hypothetical protein HDU96_003502 [Phlyctochytrium bullatum]
MDNRDPYAHSYAQYTQPNTTSQPNTNQYQYANANMQSNQQQQPYPTKPVEPALGPVPGTVAPVTVADTTTIAVPAAKKPPRESKKFVSRGWLLFINIVGTIIAIAIVIVGAYLRRNAGKWSGFVGDKTRELAQTVNSSIADNKLGSADKDISNFQNDIRKIIDAVALALIIYGSYLLLMAFTGIVGACTRNIVFLSIHIGAVAISLATWLSGAGYFLRYFYNERTMWDTMTPSKWQQDDLQRWSWQDTYECCGLDSPKSFPYTESLVIDGVELNPCRETSSLPGCRPTAQNQWNKVLLYTWIVYAGMATILITSIMCAIFARKASRRVPHTPNQMVFVVQPNTPAMQQVPPPAPGPADDAYLRSNDVEAGSAYAGAAAAAAGYADHADPRASVYGAPASPSPQPNHGSTSPQPLLAGRDVATPSPAPPAAVTAAPARTAASGLSPPPRFASTFGTPTTPNQ